MNRRDFLKLSVGGVATIVVGSKLSWLCGEAQAAHLAPGQTLRVLIADAVKEMVTHNATNPAECYFWGYHMDVVDAGGVATDVPYECPGPTILITQGEQITFEITNTLDEPHALFIPGNLPGDPPQFDSCTDAVDITDNTTKYPNGIPPGKTVKGTFTASQPGAFLYYDNLNAPVNRMMGLHGALVVQPSAAKPGHKFTPYDPSLVSVGVQKMYDDFGSSVHFPGLAWEEGDPATQTPPFRTYVWLTHQASPNLFAEVGNYTAGLDYPAQEFVDKFLNSQFSPTNASYTPQFFTINGQSGMFAHFGPYNTPIGRVGEPVVVHILNAGLWTHSMHLHANHFYVTSANGVVSENPIWVDVYNVKPMDRIDYTIPFMRPPDLPNVRGIGYPDRPLVSPSTGRPVWPPVEELDMYIPGPGEKTAKDINGNTIDLKQRMSPLCYPMHDHSEPSQTAQGGNYNCGLISGIYFTGDRNTPGFMNFPMDEDFAMMYRNIRGCYPGAWPPAGDTEATGYAQPA